MLRVLICAGLAFALLLSPLSQGQANAKIRVVTTFTIIADMARNVAGDRAEVMSITKPGAEIHGYQPTPRDITGASGADVILWNGLGLELWFERFFETVGGPEPVEVSQGVVPIPISTGPYVDRANPHAWMSITSAEIYIGNIRDALTRADPEGADIYAANAKAYLAQIQALDAGLAAKLANVPEAQRWLVTSEGAFSYLARDLDLKELYIWPINADQQGTPQQVRAVIDAMRENNVQVVFSESTVSDKPARQIARETGARYGGVLYVDSLSEADGPVPTYLDLLTKTVSTIADGLTQ